MENISDEIKKRLLYLMIKIRHFEEKIISVYHFQDMKTPVHLYIGEEAVAAAVCANLRKDDYALSTHRNHGHYIAKGVDINVLMAELYGKEAGCSKGKGGSMHPVFPEFGILGTSAIVGGSVPIAVGAALASKLRNENKVSVAFFGDGSTEEGSFHESMNFASLKKLPMVFICENNFYATNSHLSARQPHDNIAKRAESYNMPGIQVNGNNVLGIYNVAQGAIDNARDGNGPSLIECRTYRWKGHVGPECDYEKGCRPKKELEDWMEKCPIESFSEYLLRHQVVTYKELQNIRDEIDRDIETAWKFGRESAYPESKEVFNHVYFKRG